MSPWSRTSDVPPTGRRSPTRWLAGLVVFALALVSCTSVDNEDPPSTGDESAPSASTQGAAEELAEQAIGSDAEPTPPLQDLWFFTRMRTVGPSGDTADVVGAVLEELEGLAAEPITLTPALTFRPLPTLNARIDRVDGSPREGVRAIAGLFEVTEAAAALDVVDDGFGSALGVVASADGDVVHVTPGDQLSLDLFALQSLAAEELVLVDYAFGQTVPATDDAVVTEPVGDDLALLAERFADGRVAFGAPESDLDGDVAIVEGIPMQRLSTVPSPTPFGHWPSARSRRRSPRRPRGRSTRTPSPSHRRRWPRRW